MAGMDFLDEGQEMRLDETSVERTAYRQLEEIYSLMRACDHLENAYLRDAVSAQQYTSQCMGLIGKFDQALKLAQASGAIRDIREFLTQYGIKLPAAEKRLLEEKVPATAVHMQGGDGQGNNAEQVALVELLPGFVTLLDAGGVFSCPEQILPHLLFVSQNLANYTALPASWEGRAKISRWLSRFRGMNATDEVPAEERANFRLEVEMIFEEFRHSAMQRAQRR